MVSEWRRLELSSECRAFISFGCNLFSFRGDMHMEPTYSLLGLVELQAGTWADWFAGSMSFAAVAAALGGFWIAGRQRRADEADRDHRAGVAIGWKAFNTFNHTANVAQYFKKCLESPAAADESSLERNVSRRFFRVRPLGLGNTAVADVTPDEVSLLLRAKGAEFLMELSLCIQRWESIRYAMSEYKVRHEALFELMPPPVAIADGARFTHRLDADQLSRVLPYAKMLDALLDGVIELVDENTSKSQLLLEQFPVLMKAHFGRWEMGFEGDFQDVDLSGIVGRTPFGRTADPTR
jgi:hypothetical protein